MFYNKVFLITGGTGSFGHAFVRRFLDTSLQEIRILSRDEKKQDDMRKRFANTSHGHKLKFYLGDVRDQASLLKAMRGRGGVDFIFHAAALKQVPSCEFYPLEAVKTNVLGTENVLEVAIELGVKKIVCLSTDKAVYPINAMGISKAMMEKVALAKSRESKKTDISVTRYGNVMASRGSVIPLFIQQILQGDEITVTDPLMTRFMMSLDEAVDLVMYAFEYGKSGDIFVQKSPAATIETLVQALKELLSKPNLQRKMIGTRHGEKQHETLLSQEEMAVSEDFKQYYRVPIDGRDLNYAQYVDSGEGSLSGVSEYTSENTHRLDVADMKALLLKLPMIQFALEGRFEMGEVG